jgi:hypothetical protein
MLKKHRINQFESEEQIEGKVPDIAGVIFAPNMYGWAQR